MCMVDEKKHKAEENISNNIIIDYKIQETNKNSENLKIGNIK